MTAIACCALVAFSELVATTTFSFSTTDPPEPAAVPGEKSMVKVQVPPAASAVLEVQSSVAEGLSGKSWG